MGIRCRRDRGLVLVVADVNVTANAPFVPRTVDDPDDKEIVSAEKKVKDFTSYTLPIILVRII